MKIIEFADPDNINFNHAVAYIKNRCSHALAACKQTKMFLGRESPRNENQQRKIYSGMPRMDRKPKDSSVIAQQLVDRLLSNAGFTALRSNSLFCRARNFNELSWYESHADYYLIFPENGFNFTCSLKYHDLTMDLKLAPRYSDYEQAIKNLRTIVSINDYNKFVADGKFFNDNFNKALQSGSEVYISGKYVAIKAGLAYYRSWDLFGIKLNQSDDYEI